MCSAVIIVTAAGCAGMNHKASQGPGGAASSTATVTVTPSISGPISLGTTFYVTVSAANMPKNGGATLGLKWNKAVVLWKSIDLAPDSAFDWLEDATVGRFSFVAVTKPNPCAKGPCSFDAVRISFTAIGPGNAEIAILDDGTDACWGDPDTLKCVVTQPAYKQADVTVFVPGPGQPR
jgi:hypothetical protein